MFSLQKRNDSYVMVMEVFAHPTVIIKLQYINISNQHIVYLKLAQCYVSTVSQ